ncbi:hypothetical protein JW935_23430 [candidate division KSB1 bacterium]|nr:hypothetical protein [candidate division KSB1 bacterium]
MKRDKQRFYKFLFIAAIVFFFLAPMVSFAGENGISKGLLKKYSAQWWQWSLSIPADVNPLGNPVGSYCGVGQHGDVWFLGGTLDGSPAERNCTVPYGKKSSFQLSMLNVQS